MNHAMTTCLIAAAALALLAAGGCGDSGPGLIPVHGKVTFNGGAPPAEGSVYFAPIESAAGAPQRPATADYGSDGLFQVGSFQPADGMYPGKYRVTVVCWKTRPGPGNMNGENLVPPGYQPPTLEVPAGSSEPVEVTYDVSAAPQTAAR